MARAIAGRRDRPQRRHRFDRGEGQVVAGDRGGGRAGMAGDESGQFAVVCWWAAVAFGEHLAAQRRADPRSDVIGQGRFGVVADGEVVVAVGLHAGA